MRSIRVATLVAVGLALAWASAPAAATPGSALAPFFQRLRAHGRADARLVREIEGVPGAKAPIPGHVTLEPPDRARLDFDQTGERVTMRSDGGEWLQPRLRQCVKLGPARARAALAWWDLLLGLDRDAFTERVLAAHRVLIVRSSEGLAADSAWISLDSAGLPTRIEVQPEGGLRETYRLSGWRFAAARGRADFVIRPPADFEVVDLP